MTRRLLVTSALPYVNGHIHIGHLVEYLQTDMWVRFQKMRGHQAIYLCADDTHGTATMIAARARGVSESVIIAEMAAAHQADFAGFGIAFDHYGSTNAESNRELVYGIWQALRAGNHVREKDVTQLFDPHAGTFLADRFVKGTCPKCGAPDQYGDSCDKCGATYSPTELKDPRSTLSGATPELRTARHYFVHLEPFREFLTQWTQSGALHQDIANWLKGTFLSDMLRDWDVSRPAPYFGFEIPDAPGNYFYVWLDAPVGYISATADWAVQQGDTWQRWWLDPTCEIHHFIGKDITYFHTLFWPAMLKTAGYQLPTKVHVHGFLTVNGEKMSKSKGTFIRARTYLDHLDPTYLRYYYAAKLSAKAEDIDLNLNEFHDKVNSDLVGKVVNLASRTAKFVPTLSPTYPDDGGLFQRAAADSAAIAEAYEAGDFGEAMRRIMALADRANEYVEQAAPWALKKNPAKSEELTRVCTIALNLFRQLCVYLAPVLPSFATQAGELLAQPITAWTDAQQPVVGNPVAAFSHMLQRVDPAKIAAMIEASRPNEPFSPAPTAPVIADDGAALHAEPLAGICTFEDFSKIDLRVARVLAAEEIPKAKKILKLTLSLGGDDRRTVYAGIKSAYQAESLIGRLVILVANLAPRTMSFGVSDGMVIAAGPGDQEIFLLAPDAGAKPGQRVH